MGKVEFKLNDSLLRRQQGDAEADDRNGATAVAVDDRPIADRARPARRASSRRRAEQSQNGAPHQPAAEQAHRPATVQTSLLLPPAVWSRLATLADEAGGLATANRLLIDILETHGFDSIEQTAEDLERFLSLPAEETAVGEPWEERNARLPIELRRRLDEHRKALRSAGLSATTRAHLVAAAILLHAPASGEEARTLMAERRAEAFRRALAAGQPPRE